MLIYTFISPDVPFLLIFFSEGDAIQAIREGDLTGTLMTVRCKSPPETGSEFEYCKALIEAIKTGKVIRSDNFY